MSAWPQDLAFRLRSLSMRLFITPPDHVLVQLVRYTIVGGAAFLLDFAVLVLLTEWVGVHYLLSAVAGFLAGVALNYALSRLWVFTSRTLTNTQLEAGIFALIGLIGLGINELALWVLTDQLGLYYPASKAVTAVFVYFWNFFARKLTLFR